MKKEAEIADYNFWRYLINFWSILFFIFIIYDFLTRNSVVGILNILATIYISVLAIYVSNKEFERWYDRHSGKHPGEVFVVIWSIVVFALIVIDFYLRGAYQIPSSVVSSYIAVLTILVVTRKSKQLYQDRRHRR